MYLSLAKSPTEKSKVFRYKNILSLIINDWLSWENLSGTDSFLWSNFTDWYLK